jgi:uncharacterized iron-regulated membrane protein
MLGATAAIAATCTAIAMIAWHGRISWRAQKGQQREAEAELTPAPG